MEITEKQEEILNRVFEEHGKDDRWELVEWTHKNIPEWEEEKKGHANLLNLKLFMTKQSIILKKLNIIETD